MKSLRGSHAILTGASRGLGVTIAQALAAEGVNLTLAARTLADLDAVRTDVAALGVDAVAVACDVTVPADRRRLVDSAVEQLGPVDLLVNNAGIEKMGEFATSPEADIESVIAVNLTAAMLLTRAVLPAMLGRARGHVVHIASTAGKTGVPFEAAYSASKFGLLGFNESLRAELDGTGVSCSAVCPGFVADDGMYARWAEQGITAPALLGTVTPKRVADAVVRAIKGDQAEVLVNRTPLLPALLLRELNPGWHRPMVKAIGVSSMFRRAMEADRGGRTEP